MRHIVGSREAEKMRRATLLVTAVACISVGCSSLWRGGGDNRFDAGVRALVMGNYAGARSDLSWVAQNNQRTEEGQRALLILAALEMDPRNPNRRIDAGAELSASFLRLPTREEWLEPIAQTLYLVGIELGVAEQRVEQAEQQRKRELPKLPGPTVSARIKNIEQERDRLAKRVSTLEEQLAEKDRELQRIKKTIKP
jgi:hypothetical protein